MNANFDATMVEKILLNRYEANEKQNAKRARQLLEKIGFSSKPDTEADSALKENLKKAMHVVLAQRLVVDDHSVPLIGPDDFQKVISEYIDSIVDEGKRELRQKYINQYNANYEEGADVDLITRIVRPERTDWDAEEYADTMVACHEFLGAGVSSEDRVMMVEVMKSVYNSFMDSIINTNDGEDPYDYYWRLIKTIQALAEEHSLPLDQPLPADLYDEVIRRMYTREQYLENNKRALKILDDPEKLIISVVKPILEQIKNGEELSVSEDGYNEILTEIKEIVSLQLAPALKMISAIAEEISIEEVNRIYPQ